MKNNNMRWILLIGVALIIFSMRGTVPKEAVADVNGQLCGEDTDCPCWGEYNFLGNETAYGLGVASCINCSDSDNYNATGCLEGTGGPYTDGMHCDTTWCFDVEPVADWAKDNPWAWMNDNPMMVIGVAALIIVFIAWPKY